MDVKQGIGYGFTGDDGRIWMVRCFQCGMENYAPYVSSGKCAWCAHDPNPIPTTVVIDPDRTSGAV